MADNLAFLGAFEHEHPYVAAVWPGLVAAGAALAAGDAGVVG